MRKMLEKGHLVTQLMETNCAYWCLLVKDIIMPKLRVQSLKHHKAGLESEQLGDFEGALKLHQKAVKADPLNEASWSRSMILLRKLKKGDQELKTIQDAIATYKKALEESQRKWAKANQEKVASSKRLAETLGIVMKDGLPEIKSEALVRWETRLHLLSHRLKNAKAKAAKKPRSKKVK